MARRSGGVVIEVLEGGRRLEEGSGPAVELVGDDLQGRYDRLVGLVLRMGAWLQGPRAQLLPAQDWEQQFALYQAQLEQLRALGDQLRPITLRGRGEPLSGDALVGEVLELFAA